MSNAPKHARPSHLLAAGGVLHRRGASGLEFACVHRRRYGEAGAGDWSLPKGKVERGESIEQAALREVLEETGCTARIVGPPELVEYDVQGVQKVVVFFPMECESTAPIVDAGEVRELLWLAPQALRERLTYELERAVVTRLTER